MEMKNAESEKAMHIIFIKRKRNIKRKRKVQRTPLSNSKCEAKQCFNEEGIADKV